MSYHDNHENTHLFDERYLYPTKFPDVYDPQGLPLLPALSRQNSTHSDSGNAQNALNDLQQQHYVLQYSQNQQPQSMYSAPSPQLEHIPGASISQEAWPPFDSHHLAALGFPPNMPPPLAYGSYPSPSPFPAPRLSPPPPHSAVSGSGANGASHRLTLAGSLDPTTGIFYRSPEHPRLRTAQACEKCRTRKAKCSGEHPSCKRCINRGLVCEYAKEGRVRGPNKPKTNKTPANGSASGSTATGETGERGGSPGDSRTIPRGRSTSHNPSSNDNTSTANHLPDMIQHRILEPNSRRNSLSLGEHRSSRPRPPNLRLEANSNHHRLDGTTNRGGLQLQHRISPSHPQHHMHQQQPTHQEQQHEQYLDPARGMTVPHPHPAPPESGLGMAAAFGRHHPPSGTQSSATPALVAGGYAVHASSSSSARPPPEFQHQMMLGHGQLAPPGGRAGYDMDTAGISLVAPSSRSSSSSSVASTFGGQGRVPPEDFGEDMNANMNRMGAYMRQHHQQRQRQQQQQYHGLGADDASDGGSLHSNPQSAVSMTFGESAPGSAVGSPVTPSSAVMPMYFGREGAGGPGQGQGQGAASVSPGTLGGEGAQGPGQGQGPQYHGVRDMFDGMPLSMGMSELGMEMDFGVAERQRQLEQHQHIQQHLQHQQQIHAGAGTIAATTSPGTTALVPISIWGTGSGHMQGDSSEGAEMKSPGMQQHPVQQYHGAAVHPRQELAPRPASSDSMVLQYPMDSLGMC